jgi:HEAT repeat protein
VYALLLLGLVLSWPAAAQQPAPERPTAADEQLLKNAGLSPTGPALVEFFRKRVSAETDADKLRALVRQLGDKAPEARDRATAELVSQGPAVIPLLRQAANDLDDAQVATRARQCLSQIEGASGRDLAAGAVRVLAQNRPPGAAEALLAYLPFAEDDQVADEIGKALGTVALRDGKADPALVKALKDPVPVRRALAGEVLSRVGGPDDRAAVRELLQDPKPSVRLRLALALADARDAEAIGVLISVLGELPADQTRQVEEFLTDLAGDWAVRVPRATMTSPAGCGARSGRRGGKRWTGRSCWRSSTSAP